MINKKEHVVKRNIHDTIYLINTKQNYLNDKCYLYEINDMGSYIWDCFSEKISIEDIVESIISDIDVQDMSFNEIRNDVKDYVNLLMKEGFLETYNGRT